MELDNALMGGGGTVCQRRDARMAVYGSKAVRMRELEVLKGMREDRPWPTHHTRTSPA